MSIDLMCFLCGKCQFANEHQNQKKKMMEKSSIVGYFFGMHFFEMLAKIIQVIWMVFKMHFMHETNKTALLLKLTHIVNNNKIAFKTCLCISEVLLLFFFFLGPIVSVHEFSYVCRHDLILVPKLFIAPNRFSCCFLFVYSFRLHAIATKTRTLQQRDIDMC